jgi:coenzyme PQQ synthesis protein D (PqqD)
MYASKHVATVYSDEGEAVLLHLRNGQFVLLTTTAAMAWKCLAKGADLNQAMEKVAHELEIAMPELKHEMAQVCDELVRCKMLVPSQQKGVKD